MRRNEKTTRGLLCSLKAFYTHQRITHHICSPAQNAGKMLWSLEEYCASQQQIDFSTLLDTSARNFLETLNLPTVHPFCYDDAPPFTEDGIPPMGRLVHRFDDETPFEILITMWYNVAPALLAMAELWLRLFAGVIAPIGIVYLIYDGWTNISLVSPKKTDSSDKKRNVSFVCVFSAASSLVLMTDTLYVLNNGPFLGVILFAVSIWLSLQTCLRYNLSTASVVLSFLVLLACHLVWDHETNSISIGDKAERVQIEEGLYFDKSNKLIRSLVENWPEKYRVYNKESGATPWMPSGDSRTGLPFLMNHLPNPEWKRVFLETFDGEYVALDISFPPDGRHDSSKPLYLLLHGLNGGSNEGTITIAEIIFLSSRSLWFCFSRICA